jgi:hypothetical protein
VTAVIYTGSENLTYSGYIDLLTGKTLACSPGGRYDVMPVNAGPEVPADGRFRFTLASPPEESELVPDDPEEETPALGEER